jgi:regulator of cell morphogenesis and NO signaling
VPLTTLNPQTTLAEIVNLHPPLARELEGRDLDYCCGGAATLSDACTAKDLDVATVIDELLGAATDEPSDAWLTMSITELVDHLESTHHDYLWNELPRLAALTDKVVSVHSGRHPELAQISTCFKAIRSDLEPHLTKEERVLFPMIRELDSAAAAEGSTVAPSFRCGSIQNPISVMLTEHDAVGELLRRLSELTGGYQVPDDGCASYAALFAGFHELEIDTHLHIHKENNVLFPAVLKVERRLTS